MIHIVVYIIFCGLVKMVYYIQLNYYKFYTSQAESMQIDESAIKKALKSGKLIGKGTNGNVYLVEIDIFNQFGTKIRKKYAIKQIDISNFSRDKKKIVENEVQTMARINHQNVVELIAKFVGANQILLVMEYCQYSLYQYIQQGRLRRKDVDVLFRQILKGYQYLLDNKIVHRDMKPENILVKLIPRMTPVIKLADFGSSKQLVDHNQMLKSRTGTPLYCAPQIMMESRKQNTKYSIKCDIWSLGVIYYQMLTGRSPWKQQGTFKELCAHIHETVSSWKNNPHIELWDSQGQKISNSDKILIQRMLTIQQSSRISWQDLFNYFFIETKTKCTVAKDSKNISKGQQSSNQNVKKCYGNVDLKGNKTIQNINYDIPPTTYNYGRFANNPKTPVFFHQPQISPLQGHNGR